MATVTVALSLALSSLYAPAHTTPCTHLLCTHAAICCPHGTAGCPQPLDLSCSGSAAHVPGSLHLLHLLIRALVLLALLGLRDRGICPQPGAPQGHNRHNDGRIAPVLGRRELAQGQVRPLRSSGQLLKMLPPVLLFWTVRPSAAPLVSLAGVCKGSRPCHLCKSRQT